MKNTTPAECDLLLSALVWAGLALEALALLLRPVLAHAIATALLLAGWRPTPQPHKEPAKPKQPTPAAKPKAAAKRRTRRPVPVAA
jgi:hypothetical protein